MAIWDSTFGPQVVPFPRLRPSQCHDVWHGLKRHPLQDDSQWIIKVYEGLFSSQGQNRNHFLRDVWDWAYLISTKVWLTNDIQLLPDASLDWILECRLVALDRPSMKLLRSQMCDPILQQNAAREGAASERFHWIDCLGAKLNTSPSLFWTTCPSPSQYHLTFLFWQEHQEPFVL